MKSALAVALLFFFFLLSFFFLFFSLPLSLFSHRRGEATDRACWELFPVTLLLTASFLASLPPTGLETAAAAAANTKANIDMHGGETRPAVAPLKVFQMTRSQSHRCSHSRTTSPPLFPAVLAVPVEGPDCLRLVAFSFFTPEEIRPFSSGDL